MPSEPTLADDLAEAEEASLALRVSVIRVPLFNEKTRPGKAERER
jgi:hypothetical protein